MHYTAKIYRGIKLHRDAKVYKKNGKIYEVVASGLDNLIDTLKEKNHELVGEYKNARTKVLIDFRCGHEPQLIYINAYKNGNECPKCGVERGHQFIEKKKRKAENEFKELVNKNSHQLLSEYRNNRTKVLIDFRCGHKPHKINPNAYRSGFGCPKCAGNCSEESKRAFIELLQKNGHILLDEYTNVMTKVTIDFKCGHEPHLITPHHYKKGSGCPKCGKTQLLEYNKQQKEKSESKLIDLINNNGHQLLSEYRKNQEKVCIDFNCGHKPHWIRPNDYKNGKGCPECAIEVRRKINKM